MKRSLKHGGGFFEIDHRESPGLTPADIATMPGAILVGKGQHFESDMYLCTHCQRMIALYAVFKGLSQRGYCRKCDHYICNRCQADYEVNGGQCVPIKAVVDVAQETAVKYAGQPDHPDAQVDPFAKAQHDAEKPRIVLTDVP